MRWLHTTPFFERNCTSAATSELRGSSNRTVSRSVLRVETDKVDVTWMSPFQFPWWEPCPPGIRLHWTPRRASQGGRCIVWRTGLGCANLSEITARREPRPPGILPEGSFGADATHGGRRDGGLALSEAGQAVRLASRRSTPGRHVRAQNEVKENDEERENQQREHHEETSESRCSVVDCLPFHVVSISFWPLQGEIDQRPA